MTDFSVDKVAKLAYLKLTDSEKSAFTTQFRAIINYVDQLQKVAMSPEEANRMGAFHISTAFIEMFKLDPSFALRTETSSDSDESRLKLSNSEALQNAPRSNGIPGELLFEVPSIIERD